MEFNRLTIGEPTPALELLGDQAAGVLAYLISSCGFDVERPERLGDKVQIAFYSRTYEGERGSLRRFVFSLMAEKLYSEEEIRKMYTEIMESAKRVGVVCLSHSVRREYGEH